MIRTIFLAPPGAGKGTQAKKLAEATGAIHVSTGDALRLAVEQKTSAGLEAKKYMDLGDLVPDEVVLRIVRDSLQKSSKTGWILDGFPRNQEQAIALDSILAELGQNKYCTIYFEVSHSILIQRISGRFSDLGRSDDDPNIALNRLEIYKKQTEPLIKFYNYQKILRDIDGNQSIEFIFTKVKEVIESFDYS